MNETAVIRVARRNLVWLRWGWLCAGPAAYIVWYIVDQIARVSFRPILGGFSIDWRVIALLVIILVLFINYRQDRQLVLLEDQIVRTMTAERAVLQREAAQAKARADALATSERLKSTLLAAVSHDYRTPLASIIAAADELLAEDVDWTPEALHDFAWVIRTEAERLTYLGANLLDLTRIEAGVLRPRLGWYNIAEIINRVLDRFASDVAERPLELDVPDNLPLLPVDYVQIEQVLWNIVQNALKYSSPGTALTIGAASDGSAALVSVSDRGPGIPPAERARVFEPFYRLRQGAGARVEGAGIGLTICKGVIESHGGSIAIGDRDGGGALVQIRLPLHPAEISADQGAYHGVGTYPDHR